MPHLVTEFLVLGLRGLIDAFAVNIEQPTVIEAAQAAVFNATVRQISTAMRAMKAD